MQPNAYPQPYVLPGRYPPGYGVGPVAPPYAQQGWGMPPGYPYYPPARMVEIKNPALAAGLELIGGAMFQTFGVGHLYAGNYAAGIAWMLGWWFVSIINFVLCFFLIGFLTWPLCWVAAMALSAMTASSAAKRANAAAGYPNAA